MRSIQALGLTCIATLSFAALADEPRTRTAAVVIQPDAVQLQGRSPAAQRDRLGYLDGPRCLERRGCSTSRPAPAYAEPSRNYIRSLGLGSYGPMDFKFTGDRLKMKVRF